MTVSLTESMLQWIKYDPIKRVIIAEPTEITHLGLTRIKITLKSSKNISIHYKNIWVISET